MSSGASQVPQGGGKEELRASFLKPYLLRLRDEKGEKAMRALLSTAGFPPSALENETAWLSVAAARRALAALEAALGRKAIARRGPWMVHPETLGSYVRLLRSARQPLDAYKQLCEHAQETTRVGTYSLQELGRERIRITYRPIAEDEEPDNDPLLSLAREAELAGIPQLWGMQEAMVTHEASLSQSDPVSVYLISWKPTKPRSGLPLAALLGVLISGVPVLLVGNSWGVAVIAASVGLLFGATIGYLTDQMKAEKNSRAFEKNRIAALERGLELRGEISAKNTAPGELGGTILGGKYRILNKIGSGGIGVVYSAEHTALGSLVAVKVLRGAAARDASEIARLRREAQIQVSLQHPNVIQTFDLDQMPDGSLYVVMELLRGRTLADKMGKEGPIAPGFAIPMFIHVSRALGAAHSKGVIHRDMKPGNIFLCDDGLAKVLDFGMSKFQAAESLTQDGYTLGTPEYMSPEQCIGAPVEPRTDLYSFGVLMYEALTGELPIQSPNRRELLDLHQRQVPLSMRARRPDLPISEALDEAVMACLRKRMSERPRDARALEAMLAAIPLEGLPTSYGSWARRKPSRAEHVTESS